MQRSAVEKKNEDRLSNPNGNANRFFESQAPIKVSNSKQRAITAFTFNMFITRDKEYPFNTIIPRINPIFEQIRNRKPDIVMMQELPNPNFEKMPEFLESAEYIKGQFEKDRYILFTQNYPSRKNMCDLGIAFNSKQFYKAEAYPWFEEKSEQEEKRVVLAAAGYLNQCADAETSVHVVLALTYHPSFLERDKYLKDIPEIIESTIKKIETANKGKTVYVHDVCLGLDSNAFNNKHYLRQLYEAVSKPFELNKTNPPGLEQHPVSWLLLRTDPMFTQLYQACKKINLGIDEYLNVFKGDKFQSTSDEIKESEKEDPHFKKLEEYVNKSQNELKDILGRTPPKKFIEQLKRSLPRQLLIKLANQFAKVLKIEPFINLSRWLDNIKFLTEENQDSIFDAIMVLKAHSMYAPIQSSGAVVDIMVTASQGFISDIAIVPPLFSRTLEYSEELHNKIEWLKKLNHFSPNAFNIKKVEKSSDAIVTEPVADHYSVGCTDGKWVLNLELFLNQPKSMQ